MMMNKNLLGVLDQSASQNRPGSAPPMVDDAEHPQRGTVFSSDHLGVGLFASTEPSSAQQMMTHQAPERCDVHSSNTNSAGGGISEAKLNDQSFLSDPEYIRYYYANKNINPRLPPPNVGQNRTSVDWGMLDNSWAKGQAMLGTQAAQVGREGPHGSSRAQFAMRGADTRFPCMRPCRPCRSWEQCQGPLPRPRSTCSSPRSCR